MMTALTRWAPSNDAVRDRLDRLVNQAFSDFLAPVVASEEVSSRRWMPTVDIHETEDALVLNAELPGLSREDVHITLENQVLTLSGERKFETESKDHNYHRVERSYGAFSRSFMMPANVQADKVDASFNDGVLTVKLPKAEEAKPRKIAIK